VKAFSGIFFISAEKEYRLNISDIAGRQIMNAMIFAGENQIDLSSFPPGIYLITLKTENEIKNCRIVRI
jgi:hypothetical protein